MCAVLKATRMYHVCAYATGIHFHDEMNSMQLYGNSQPCRKLFAIHVHVFKLNCIYKLYGD